MLSLRAPQHSFSFHVQKGHTMFLQLWSTFFLSHFHQINSFVERLAFSAEVVIMLVCIFAGWFNAITSWNLIHRCRMPWWTIEYRCIYKLPRNDPAQILVLCISFFVLSSGLVSGSMQLEKRTEARLLIQPNGLRVHLVLCISGSVANGSGHDNGFKLVLRTI